MIRSLFRAQVVFGLLACAPLFAALPAAPAPTLLTDEEVKGFLDRNETAVWTKTLAAKEQYKRDLESAKKLAEVNPKAELKGYLSETPEQRKVKSEKLVAIATGKIADADKQFDDLRAAANTRFVANSISVDVPALTMPEALKKSSGVLLAAAKNAGVDRLSVVTVLTLSNDRLVADAGVTASYQADLSAGPIPVDGNPVITGSSLTLPSPRSGVIISEAYPNADVGGTFWFSRLIDGKTFRVLAMDVSLIPSGKTLKSLKPTDRPPAAYELEFKDRANFLGRLGQAEAWSFGVEGGGDFASLLTTALFRRAKPEVNSASLLFSVKGDKTSKAFWIPKPGKTALDRLIFSRPASGEGAPVQVGTLELKPLTEEQVKQKADAALKAAEAAAKAGVVAPANGAPASVLGGVAAVVGSNAAGALPPVIIAPDDTEETIRRTVSSLVSSHTRAEGLLKIASDADKEARTRDVELAADRLRTLGPLLAEKLRTTAQGELKWVGTTNRSNGIQKGQYDYTSQLYKDRKKKEQRFKDALTSSADNIARVADNPTSTVSAIESAMRKGLDALKEWENNDKS